MLELADLGHAYQPHRWVFRGVSLRLESGSIAAVLGPNGRGKTTLLRCAAGLLRPTEGSVRHAGVVGFVPQAHGTTFGYRALDMVLMGRARHVPTFGSPGRRDRDAAWAALERVGMADLAYRPFTAMSGGEAQLVLIARAIASGSEVLALDEPATGLDLRNQGRVLTILRELAGQGMTVLVTTHHPDHALHVADVAVLMHGPAEVAAGPAETMLVDSALSRLYGIGVRSVAAPDGAGTRRVLVTDYGGAGWSRPSISSTRRRSR